MIDKDNAISSNGVYCGHHNPLYQYDIMKQYFSFTVLLYNSSLLVFAFLNVSTNSPSISSVRTVGPSMFITIKEFNFCWVMRLLVGEHNRFMMLKPRSTEAVLVGIIAINWTSWYMRGKQPCRTKFVFSSLYSSTGVVTLPVCLKQEQN